MTDKIVVLTTCGSQEEAQKIARLVLEQRLAACVNVMPKIESLYWWNGAIESSGEFLLIIKSSRGNYQKLQAEIAKAHSYEVPEVIALPVVEGRASYLEWMDREMTAP